MKEGGLSGSNLFQEFPVWWFEAFCSWHKVYCHHNWTYFFIHGTKCTVNTAEHTFSFMTQSVLSAQLNILSISLIQTDAYEHTCTQTYTGHIYINWYQMKYKYLKWSAKTVHTCLVFVYLLHFLKAAKRHRVSSLPATCVCLCVCVCACACMCEL